MDRFEVFSDGSNDDVTYPIYIPVWIDLKSFMQKRNKTYTTFTFQYG